jgi:hypothetical protein
MSERATNKTSQEADSSSTAKTGNEPVPQPSGGKLDFRSEGPVPWFCQLCRKPYKGWEVSDEDWRKLPSEYQELMLCEDDYRELLRKAGHDPDRVHITHKTHEHAQAYWEKSRAQPEHHVKILFPGESLWCEVLQDHGNGKYVVRLRNTSFFHPSARAGALYLAKWDRQKWHRRSGRPMFTPIRPLCKLPGKAKGMRGVRHQRCPRRPPGFNN